MHIKPVFHHFVSRVKNSHIVLRINVVLVLLAFFLVAGSAYLSLQANADSGKYLIDFGDTTHTTTASGWNNISGAQARDTTTVIPLMESSGTLTSVTLQFTDGFDCVSNGTPVNNVGTQTSTLYPASATMDSFYLGTAGGACTQDDTSASFVLSSLSQDATYDLKFYASRAGFGDTSNRTTDYTVGTTTVKLNATDNVDGIATITDVTPVNGTITVTVAKASESAMYGYLGVLEIIKKSTVPPPLVNAGLDQAITLPTHEVTLSGSATATVGTIATYSWTEVSSGAATIVSPTSATTTVTDLAYGTYTFRLTATTTEGVSASDDVTVTVAPHQLSCPAKKIVVLGSSTAQGTGADPVSNSWVNRFTAYLQMLNPNTIVTNLAFGGYTTYHAMPTGYVPPANRPAPDTNINITKALSLNPDAILVNYASNDTVYGYAASETETNMQTISNTATQAGIPLWFATTQPRTSGLDQTGRDTLMTIRDWTKNNYPTHFFDFWTTLANSDGTITSIYGASDGVHLNNLGHQKLYARVSGSNLIDAICATPTPTPTSTNTPTPTRTPTPTPVPLANGLVGSYFKNSTLTGTPALSRIDPTVNFNWGTGRPTAAVGLDKFSARWTGYVKPAYSQTYTFYAKTDDGVRLWVNGVLLINQWTIHNATEYSGKITLTAGKKYAIKLEYFENIYNAVAQLSWSSASRSKQIIPQANLFTR